MWFWTKRSRERTTSQPELDAAAIVRKARRLQFRIRPQAVSALAGAYRGARPGTGLTFAELRAYEPGDEVRHLDWNVTARQGRPYVRRYIEERALTLWLIVDVSASMRFGATGRTKADRAAQAAALLASSAIQNGDRVGLALVSDRLEAELRPRGGSRHLSRLLRTLVATPVSSRGTDLTVGLNRFGRATRRALIIVLGDFLDLGPSDPWRSVARRHEVVAARIINPFEESLPKSALIAIEDAETGRRRVIDTGSRRVRDSYTQAAQDRRAVFLRWVSESDLSSLELPTSEDPISPLLRFFRGRTFQQGPAGRV